MNSLLIGLLVWLSHLVVLSKGQPVSTRIVGGSDAGSSEFPFFIRWGGCGATLIHNDIALGAAHCGGASVAYVGTTERSGLNDGSVATTVVGRVSHPQFNRDTYEYDYSVLKLGAWVDNKRLATLADLDPQPGDPLTILGFGLTSEGGVNSPTLQKGQVNNFPISTCRDILGDLNPIVEDIMICALGEGTDTCIGDSGGPVLDAQGRQVALPSFGVGCARPGVPAVYAKISGGSDWIREQVCNLSDNPPDYCFEELESREIKLRVDITYDSNPGDVSWTLRDSQGQILQQAGVGSTPNITLSTTFGITSGIFELEIVDTFDDTVIEDTFEDAVIVRSEEWSFNVAFIDGEGRTSTLASGKGVFGTQTRTFEVVTPAPTSEPTLSPTNSPTDRPTERPTERPTARPTERPTDRPTERPTERPTVRPTERPTDRPTERPTERPTAQLTERPTDRPTERPTERPTLRPTNRPSPQPTSQSTSEPTRRSTPSPTRRPTNRPSLRPTSRPTTLAPTQGATEEPAIQLLRVNIVINETPLEVAWKIRGLFGGVEEASYEPGYYRETGSFTHLVVLEEGTYVLEVSNLSGDGGVFIEALNSARLPLGSIQLLGSSFLTTSSTIINV